MEYDRGSLAHPEGTTDVTLDVTVDRPEAYINEKGRSSLIKISQLLPVHVRNMSTSTNSGTQSPPLEATGEEKPMGFSSVNSDKEPVEVVPDKEQRKGILMQIKCCRPSYLTAFIAYFPDTVRCCTIAVGCCRY